MTEDFSSGNGADNGGVRAALSHQAADSCDITVVLCTRNRGDVLRSTLEALSVVRVPEGRTAEMFLVDNGSTDSTRSVAESFRWASVDVTYLRVVEKGLARGQNCALRLSRGRVVLFLDDDVHAPPDWLEVMSEPVLSGAADAVGGGVEIPEAVKPPWTIPDHEEWLASTAYWEPDREPVLIGASMAIGRHVFAALGGFDEELGFAPDTMFSHRLLDAEYRLVLRHDHLVAHHVDLSRFTRSGLTRQAALRAEFRAFELRHWIDWRPTFPYLRWLRAHWQLARIRLGLAARLTDENLRLPEMRLIQEVVFWPAFIRLQKEPLRYRRRRPELSA